MAKEVHTAFGTVRKRCTCSHAYQDKRYGKGVRIMNRCAKQGQSTARCTVCGTVR